MDYLCFLLFAVVVVLAVLALLGHALWLATVGVVQAIFGPAPTRRGRGRRSVEFCAGCGFGLAPQDAVCPECHLAPDSPAARELRELEITARRLQALRDSQALDGPTCARVYRCIEGRQQALLTAAAEALPVTRARPAAEPGTALTVAQRLDRLLGACADVRNLTLGNRQQALAWYRRLSTAELPGLSPGALLALARLLRMAALGSRSLQVFRVLLETHPSAPVAAAAALEAGQFAAREQADAEARWFLERALRLPLAEEARREAEAALRGLALPAQPPPVLPVEEPILEVLPVVRPAASAVPHAAEPTAPAASTPAPAPAGRPPRRSLGQLLAAFMEERNILWGELVGGLLIVGCSIALVISLWQTLEQIPYFPFLIFAALTGATFGAGLYTLSHWKLESTSRGLLVIATLLVPLNFFILAGLTRGGTRDLLDVAAEVGALGVFTGLVLLAARPLLGPDLPTAFGRAERLLAVAVLGTGAVQLFIPRVLDVEAPQPGLVLLLAFVAVLCHGLPLASVLAAAGRGDSLDGRQAGKLLVLLGLATFALAVALGFFIYRSAVVRVAVQRLAVPVAIAGIPILAAGLVLHRKLAGVRTAGSGEGEPAPAMGLAPEVARTIGTGVALGGMLILLVALALAWPVPLALLAVAALNFAVLEVAAARGRLPLAIVPALLCLVAGYLVGLHLLHGNLTLTATDCGDLLPALAASPLSGSGLVLLALALAGAGEGLTRAGRRAEGLLHAAGGGAVALFSMVLVACAGAAVPERGALVFGAYAAAALAVNVRWRQPLLTYASSGLLLVALGYALLTIDPELGATRLVLLALLSEATLALGAWLSLGGVSVDRSGVERGFAVPLRVTALASSFAAALLLPAAVGWDWLVPAALCSAWLGALWLVVAWRERRPALFSASQAALALAALFAASHRIQGQPWFNDAEDLFDPRSYQAHGIALGLYGLLWVAARLSLRANPTAQLLAGSPWPAVDRLVLFTGVGTQLVVSFGEVIPNVGAELLSGAVPVAAGPFRQAFLGPAAWLWLGVLLTALLAGLWERLTRANLCGLIVTAVTGCLLVAGEFAEERAANVALRWALAVCYLGGAILLWLRVPLGRLAGRLGIRTTGAEELPAPVRAWLLALAALPVLILSVLVAGFGFSGNFPAAPNEGSFFAEVGWVAAQVVPLVLVALALAGHGAREASAGNAFAGGLVAVFTLTAGYALGVVTGGGVVDVTQGVRLLQMGAAGAAVWLLLWLALWRRLVPADSRPAREVWGTMLAVQRGLAVAGLVALLFVAVTWFLDGAGSSPDRAWTAEAGSPLGWLAFLLGTAAAWLLGRQTGWRDSALGLGLTGLGAAALLACSVERIWPGWGYRALMFGWAAFAMNWALVPTGEERARPTSPGSSTKGVLLCGTGLLALVIAWQAAEVRNDQLWAAGTAVLLAVGCAALAWRMQAESWAFLAALGSVLAAALAVWYANRAAPLDRWGTRLLQVQLLTAGAMAVLWLRLRERIYPRGLTLSASPLLAVLAGGCFLGNAVLLGMALVPLLLFPAGTLPLWVEQAGHFAGWLALLPALAAVVGYLRRVASGLVVHALGGGGLLLGVLAACSAERLAGPGTWLPQHVLALAWGLLGLVILAASWAGSSLPAVGPSYWPPARRARAAALLGELFPVGLSRRWVEVVAVLVAGLALRGAWGDPARPYWSAAATLTASALLGALALWARRPAHVYASGLLVNVVGFLAWKAWVADRVEGMAGVVPAQELFATFVYLQVLALAAASGLWGLLDLGLRRRTPPVNLRGGVLPFCHFASLLAVHLLALIVLGGVVSDLTRTELPLDRPLGWAALAALVAALGVGFWDPEAPCWGVPLPPLYVAGLTGVGLALHAAALPPDRLCQMGALALAAFVLLASAAAAWVGWPGLFRRVGISAPAEGPSAPWFVPAQGLLAGLVVGVSLWACVGFASGEDRFSGPLAVALLVLAAALLPGRWPALAPASGWGSRADLVRYLTLGLLTLMLAEAVCAGVDPTGPAPWLERTALVTALLTLLGVLHGSAFPGLLRRRAEWADCARRCAAPLLGLACVALGALLGQELERYDSEARSTPLSLAAVGLASLAVAALVASGIAWAASPHRDPLGLSEGKRQLYVYAAEVLLVVLVLHLRLNGLEAVLQRLGAGWTLAVVALAYLGVGLGEFFRRRGLRGLAEPLQRTGLFLPLLPLLAFLAQPVLGLDPEAAQAFPGLAALRRYLDRLAGHYALHALVWFLLAGLYLLASLPRRSAALGLLAALAANFGLWVLFANYEPLAFLVHPQAWLIPLALIVLATEHANRDRLTRAQGLSLRYLGLLLLYVSSTADLFIAGLGNSVLLPVLLALLAVLGVFAGIVLRVRAFLLMGVAFLFLVIFAQIWHAAVDRAQTWVWWASGIVLGACILAVFALFEKRRNDVLKMIDEIKRWQ